jgi:hypothetical protein
MKEAYFENLYAEFWIENGIFFISYKQGLVINIEIAKQNVADRLRISNGITRPMFTDGRNFVSIDLDSMEYLKSKDAMRYISAGAFLMDNYLHKLMGNLFLTIDKPPVPAKLFTDKEAALQWLEQFKYTN